MRSTEVGNDPELLLLMECDLTTETPKWRYRFAQSTRSTTVATRNGMEIYRYENDRNDPGRKEAPYYSRHGVEQIAAELDSKR